MFRDVDAAIMMPGASTAHPAYLAMQDWLKDDLTEHRGRRTVHFHWLEAGSAYPIAGQPLPSRSAPHANYPRPLLGTDYKALCQIQPPFPPPPPNRRFANARVVRIPAAIGKDAVEAEMQKAGNAGRAFREIGLGLNPLLAVPDRAPWIPDYGYGAGVVRLSLGDNTELGGTVGGN